MSGWYMQLLSLLTKYVRLYYGTHSSHIRANTLVIKTGITALFDDTWLMATDIMTSHNEVT